MIARACVATGAGVCGYVQCLATTTRQYTIMYAYTMYAYAQLPQVRKVILVLQHLQVGIRMCTVLNVKVMQQFSRVPIEKDVFYVF